VPAIVLALLPAAAIRLPMPEWNGGLLLSAAIWLLLIGLVDTMPVALAGGTSRTRLTALFDFGAMLCFSVVPAALLAGLGRVGAALLTRRSLRATLGEAAESMLAIAVSGVVFFERGGTAGIAAHPAALLFVPTVLAMGVFALVSAGVAAWRDAALGERGITTATAAREQLLTVAIVLPFGVAFAWLEATSGPVAGTCALILILLSRRLESNTVSTTTSTSTPTAPRPRPADDLDPQLETVRLLMSAIDAFDPFTRGHSGRIARASVVVARRLGLDAREVVQVEYAALLHDIGRTAIHLDILTRPGTLSGDEVAMLHTHPAIGSQIVSRIPGLDEAAEIVLTHHEQPDGRGYPRGLKGNAIPIGSRIIMVVAAFDAMTRERPYRRGLDAASAYQELRRHAGTQFFSDVVETYIQLHTSRAFEAQPELADAFAPAQDAGGEGRRAA